MDVLVGAFPSATFSLHLLFLSYWSFTMTDASDVTPEQAGIYAETGEGTDTAEFSGYRPIDPNLIVISIPRQYDEASIPPLSILPMQDDILRAIGLAPEQHTNDMAWSFQLGNPNGQKAILAWPVMALTTTQEIWDKLTSITGKMAFFWSPNDRCMDVLILLQAPAKTTLRGYPIRENYHVLQLIDYTFYREPNWVPGFQIMLNEQLPYFKPEFVGVEGKWEDAPIPNLRDVISMRAKQERVTEQQTQRRVLESFELRFPNLGFTKALGNVLSMIDRIPSVRAEVDRDKFFRGLCAQKSVLINRMDAELGKRTLHISIDAGDPEPGVTAELICSQVRAYCKDLPEPIRTAMSRTLPRGYDRSLAMPDELLPLVPDLDRDPSKSLLLGGKLNPTDQEHMLKLEAELLVGANGDGVVDERSIESFYHFLHLVISHRVDALDLEVGNEIQAGNLPLVRIRKR